MHLTGRRKVDESSYNDIHTTIAQMKMFGYSIAQTRAYIRAMQARDRAALETMCIYNREEEPPCPICKVLRLEDKFKHYQNK